MLIAVFAVSLFILVSSSVADDTIRCGSMEGTTFIKTEGDVEGRYTVKWCSPLPKNATEWNLELKYSINTADKRLDACEDNLNYSTRRWRTRTNTAVHSRMDVNITNRPVCNITCLSMPLDMVFSSCYEIGNSYFNKYTNEWNYAYHRVQNKFDSFDAINELQPANTIQQEGDQIEVTYNLHYIHIQVFGMDVKEYKQHANNSEIDSLNWVDITDNCTDNKVQVVCRLHSPRAGNCMKFSLKFKAPWRNSFKDRNVLEFCRPPSEEPVVAAGSNARVWWAAGALALTLALLAACWAAHSRVLADVRKKVLRQWVHRYTTYTAEPPPAAVEPGHILLLYARDCEPAMDAIAVLKEMLEEGAPGRVYDIFSESCMSLYAPAPEEWLCGMLARPDVRIVLVQTPAAAALYAAQVSQDNLQMQQPLLGARVQYRRPHYGDVLLQFALRLVRDMAPMQQEYARYYIANVSEVEWDLMPQVAPYRRYALPAHAARLLADLRLPQQPQQSQQSQQPQQSQQSQQSQQPQQPQRLRALAAHVDRLLAYVADNENYLRDELMFI